VAKSATGKEKISKAEATIKALQLRKAGLTQREIAEQIERSPGYVNKLLKGAMEEFRNVTAEEADDLRALQAVRLEHAMRSIWADVIRGDLRAVDRFLRICQRQAALFGLDAPNKTALTDPSGENEYTAGGGMSALLKRVQEASERAGS